MTATADMQAVRRILISKHAVIRARERCPGLQSWCDQHICEALLREVGRGHRTESYINGQFYVQIVLKGERLSLHLREDLEAEARGVYLVTTVLAADHMRPSERPEGR